MTSLDFLKALLILKCLISSINRELNIRTLYKTSLFIMTVKTLLSNSLLISLRHKSIKEVSYIKTNISINKGCFTGISAEIKWFSVTGYSVTESVIKCFQSRLRLRFSLTGSIDF